MVCHRKFVKASISHPQGKKSKVKLRSAFVQHREERVEIDPALWPLNGDVGSVDPNFGKQINVSPLVARSCHLLYCALVCFYPIYLHA